MKKITFFIALLFFTGMCKRAVTRQNNDFTDPSINLEMVYVAGGSYTMGCTFEQGSDCSDTEKPAHSVSVSSFYIGKYEVTQAQWQAVMGNNPSKFRGDNLPVEQVSWDDVQEFIQKLNRMQSQYTYRLPSEEEWEYAARGGNKSSYYKYSGSNNADYVGWYGDNSGGTTHPAGTKSPNELGIYDMSGNVWEWCSNCWRDDYNASTDCSYRVFRGGSRAEIARGVRVSPRSCITPDLCGSNLGFRLACSSSNDANDMADVLTRFGSEVEVKGENYFLEMVYVAGGSYTMGCTSEQGSDCERNEKPAHSVSVSSFYIGKYEVTQAQWQAVMGNNPSNFKGDNLPVECVSWNEVQEFIQKLNHIQSQYTYRLPSEEEWEYAARGGSKSNGYKYSGSNNAGYVAWYYDNSGKTTHPVGTKSPNELGIYDMSGNVWEWCSNCWRYNYNAFTDCSYRVFRGGSCFNFARNVRVSSRYCDTPDIRSDLLGFRLACSSK